MPEARREGVARSSAIRFWLLMQVPAWLPVALDPAGIMMAIPAYPLVMLLIAEPVIFALARARYDRFIEGPELPGPTDKGRA